jgi:hypothetical protein
LFPDGISTPLKAESESPLTKKMRWENLVFVYLLGTIDWSKEECFWNCYIDL